MFGAGYDYDLSAEQESSFFTSVRLNRRRYHADGKSGGGHSDTAAFIQIK